MKSISSKKIRLFQEKILNWYGENRRDLPWRRTRDPYNILVSEVMLQQTQVSRVIPKYELWFEKFPTIESLPNANLRDILTAWSGLGYNRRALYLKQTAQIIVQKYKNKFPQDEESLRKLPGIGEYTAKAVLCFAFDKQVAVVDTNIRKIIILLMNQELRIKNYGSKKKHNSLFMLHNSKRETKPMTARHIQDIADALLPQGRAYDWNHALMDYAASVLKEYKIPITKQSKFSGSDRYFRGRIIKLLTEKRSIPVANLDLKLGEERLTKIIAGLVRDGLVRQDGQEIFLH